MLINETLTLCTLIKYLIMMMMDDEILLYLSYDDLIVLQGGYSKFQLTHRPTGPLGEVRSRKRKGMLFIGGDIHFCFARSKFHHLEFNTNYLEDLS